MLDQAIEQENKQVLESGIERKTIAVLYFDNGNKFVRIRNENGIITFTKKELRKNKMALEYEININKGSTYDEIVDFASHLVPSDSIRVVSEKYREKWAVGRGCHEVVIDEWPGLPPYVEVDCTTQKSLNEMVNEFKFCKVIIEILISKFIRFFYIN